MSFAASLRDQVIYTRSGREPQVQIYLTKDEMKEIKEKRRQLAAEQAIADYDSRFEDAQEACKGGMKPGTAAFKFEVCGSTLRRHHNAYLLGTTVEQGRPPLMSPEQIRKTIEDTSRRDMNKNSIEKSDWDKRISDSIAQQNGKHHARSSSHPHDPKTINKYKDLIAPHVVKQGYCQNKSRFDALSDPYSQIAFAIVCRLTLGYFSSTRSLGREVGEKPPLRDPDFFYNADGSSTYCADQLPVELRCAEGSQEYLKSQSRSAASTKKKESPALQRRSIKYMVVAGSNAMLCAITFIQDRSFSNGSIQLFRVRFLIYLFPIHESHFFYSALLALSTI